MSAIAIPNFTKRGRISPMASKRITKRKDRYDVVMNQLIDSILLTSRNRGFMYSGPKLKEKNITNHG